MHVNECTQFARAVFKVPFSLLLLDELVIIYFSTLVRRKVLLEGVYATDGFLFTFSFLAHAHLHLFVAGSPASQRSAQTPRAIIHSSLSPLESA